MSSSLLFAFTSTSFSPTILETVASLPSAMSEKAWTNRSAFEWSNSPTLSPSSSSSSSPFSSPSSPLILDLSPINLSSSSPSPSSLSSSSPSSPSSPSSSSPSSSYSSSDSLSLSSDQFLLTLSTSIILGFLILSTVIGNLFVMAAIWRDRNLQTVQNYLVASLAFADFMVACIVMPFSAMYIVTEEWTLGSVLCDIWTSADVLCCTASILHLVAIALDRYWAVNSVTYMHSRSPTKVCSIVVSVWGIALIVSIAPILGWKDPDYERRIREEKRCLLSQDMGYQIFATISTFYGPLLVILLLYWKIYKIARRRVNNRPGNRSVVHVKTEECLRSTSNGKPLAVVSSEMSRVDSQCFSKDVEIEKLQFENTNIDSDGSTNIMAQYPCDTVPNPKAMFSSAEKRPTEKPKKKDNQSRKKEGKTAKILAIITGIFIICWLPFFVLALVMPLCGGDCDPPIVVFSIFQWLGYVNSLLNPVIYTIFSRDFRNAFRKMLSLSSHNNRV